MCSLCNQIAPPEPGDCNAGTTPNPAYARPSADARERAVRDTCAQEAKSCETQPTIVRELQRRRQQLVQRRDRISQQLEIIATVVDVFKD